MSNRTDSNNLAFVGGLNAKTPDRVGWLGTPLSGVGVSFVAVMAVIVGAALFWPIG